MIEMKDRVTLITGGSRGIGRAAAELFARAGSHVIINYRRDRAAALEVQAACARHGVKAAAIQADVADKAAVDRMVAETIDRFGRIDAAVNNAGVWLHHPIDEMTEAQLRETVDINLLGTFHVCMAVTPHMKRQRSGVIINIASTAGQRGEAFHSPYAATKGAVISLTKSLAPELVEYNIRVNCVAPGWVYTDMSIPSLGGAEGEKVLAAIPMRRVAQPEEVAGPILFMASDLATFITGEILNVNGGAVLCG
ncbi:MAG TPA: SDR family oxidoreductase [candidate division Zixibacteria bacterium]|nr:SDR family oxidoreductase [candidate division Zixibacteria bacterium]MDD4917691.1 SDR family NAD(P)-dependent oxidoreductase [candidate division Zixibacteria bacterium]MDM7973594.1 SDR family oxidoreductase [candidate division Zixibacteria bacterium]HOD65582.1 SDR family oxidoreductase [candidate division Zixibacteria bacterium]HPI31689.1 SDR family oxidoreductase [candidate division Zixibacteria bacterium]